MKPFPDHIDPSQVSVAGFFAADADTLIAIECGHIRKRYERGEAFQILEAHTVAVQAGYTPPAWVLEGLSEAFAQCLDADDPQSLDTMLGLKATGKGKPLPIKAHAKKRERHRRAFEIHRLIGCLGVKPEEAAHMLLWREEGGHAAADIGRVKWLAEDWRNNYRDRWKSPEEIARTMRPGKDFFDRYPRDSWPRDALVKYLRDRYTRRAPT